jgi:hypothetical protein
LDGKKGQRYESIRNNIIPQQSKVEAIGRNRFSASSYRGLEKQKFVMKIRTIGICHNDAVWRLASSLASSKIILYKLEEIGSL